MKTPQDYMDYIDNQYLLGRQKKLSRMSMLWSKWSREMNLELRHKIENGDPEEVKLKYVYVYWINRSQLLELHHEHPSKWSKAGAKKRLAKEGSELRKLIENPNVQDDISLEEIQQRLLSGVLGGKK